MLAFLVRFTVLLALISAGVPAYAQRVEDAVQAWVGWRVFHERLVSAHKKPGAQVAQQLGRQFGLTTAQTAVLMSSGQSFIAAIQRIDDEATAEARKRYPDAFRPERPRPTITKSTPRGPQNSVRDRAIADGLYAQVEAKKQAALAEHLAGLGKGFEAAKLEQVRTYVQTSVTPRIKMAAIPQGTRPTPGLPPGLQRQAGSK